MKLAIYTAIFGKFDILKSPKIINKDIKYICFTDRKMKCKPWEVKIVKPEYDLQRENRKYKILSHKFFEDYDYTIYLDGQYVIMSDLSQNVEKWLNNNDIALLKHPKRNCLYEEAKACIEKGKDDIDLIKKQIVKYKNEGYPENNGLTANGFIIRRHTKKIEEFNELWWNEVKNFSLRDQISFCYVINKLKMNYSIIPIEYPVKGNYEFLKLRTHGSSLSYLKLYLNQSFISVKHRFKI